MIVRKILIENFRSIKKLEIELDETTVFIGNNNSGKTNVLDALYRGVRANRQPREAAFDSYDFFLEEADSRPGDAGPIKLRVTFAERALQEWPQSAVDELSSIIQFDGAGLKHVIIGVTGVFLADTDNDEAQYSWSFLDMTGAPLPSGNFKEFNALRLLCPLFYLDALRDAAREFQQRSTYFGAFVREHGLSEPVADSVLSQIRAINGAVMGSNSALIALQTELGNANALMHHAGANSVSIEPIPTRIDDLLYHTQVNVASGSLAQLPIEKQGAGTRSLSVISLFKSFVAAQLQSEYTTISTPILALEEPENHLHASAIRVLWDYLSILPGQKVITTHSGTLLARAPLESLRRLVKRGSETECRRVNMANLDQTAKNKIDYHIRKTRGEMLFASVWLLVEGQTEGTILEEMFRASGVDCNAQGIRVIEFAQVGMPCLCQVADDLSIAWHCLTDGDRQGQIYAATARTLSAGRPINEHLTTIPAQNMELYLATNGYGDIYLNLLTPAQRAALPAVGAPNYWERVTTAIPSKPQAGAAVVDALITQGRPVPTEIVQMAQITQTLSLRFR